MIQLSADIILQSPSADCLHGLDKCLQNTPIHHILDNEHNRHQAKLAGVTISKAVGDSVRFRRRNRYRLV